ncbi:MAG: hypothetical protein LBO82_03885 [Synergistaceae bacterium]|jgi:flagellin|nr:hypothetical protein [Synergistaceae bacterium]
MRINHNIPALQALGALAANEAALQKSIRRLSTGLRISAAADDAAGLAISEKMRSQIRGTDQAIRNVQDGVSMIQTAEGALESVHSMLQRMRELSVQAANDTLTSQDREFIQLEIDQLKEAIDRVANTTQFNKKRLLDGSADAEWSASILGARLLINGGLKSQDSFGQSVTFQGNYTITADILDTGRNQVLKSNIFTRTLPSGETVTASAGTKLSNIKNFVDGNGLYILKDPQTITLSLEGGGSASVTIYADDTLGLLGEKLGRALAEASGNVPFGAAGVQAVTDGTVLPNEDDPILKGLATEWLYGAARRVYDAYGLKGSGTLEIVIVDKLAQGVLAYASGKTITISREMFLPAGPPDGTNPNTNQGGSMFDDRTIAHEFAHVLTLTDPGIGAALTADSYKQGAWLIEGLAEYVHGANARVKVDLSSTDYSDPAAELKSRIGSLLGGTFAAADTFDYSAAYLATRYFDEVSRAAGGTGIKGMLQFLSEEKYLNVNTAIEEAMADTSVSGTSGFTTRALLNDAIKATNGSFDAFLDRVKAEDSNFDTGAIDGFYASGGSAMSPHDIVAGNNTYSLNPLAEWGWSAVKWPEGMPAGGVPSSIQVVSAKNGTFQSVAGTLLLHSNVVGEGGRITISGDDRLVDALGFSEIQAARNTTYSVTITDAHTGELLGPGFRMSGNTLVSALHENIDIRFPPNFALLLDIARLRRDRYGSYFIEKSGTDSFTVHVAPGSLTLQSGANEGEGMNLSFGDTGTEALGVDGVSVRSRELASRAVTILDGAIRRVSTRRARLGAYQNRLEHAAANLTAASTNLTGAESRIRDADMAQEMLDFTRLQILIQSGTAMLGQANQTPQSVLSLMRG